MLFRHSFISVADAGRLTDALSTAIAGIISDPHRDLRDISVISNHDMNQLREWNSDPLCLIDRNIPDLIDDKIRTTPQAPAVSAWDGILTYIELDTMSTTLAQYLSGAGVGTETIVPLCFSKSAWTVVAMMAVIKAGGAFTMIDAALPTNTVEKMLRHINASISLVSENNKQKTAGLTARTITVNADLLRTLKDVKDAPKLLSPTSNAAAYVSWTSDISVKPKGVIIEHRSLCSAAVASGSELNVTEKTRTLHTRPYSSSTAVFEVLLTLIHGGCVCIPSDEACSKGLDQAINQQEANWAMLTPKMLSLIDPRSPTSLETVWLTGEVANSSQVKRWSPSVELRQSYGVAETVHSLVSESLSTQSFLTTVRRPTTARCWVVSPEDLNKLVPIGAPGELIIEGPGVGRGYVGTSEDMPSGFISAPHWRQKMGPTEPASRFLRTGDIVTYSADGSLNLLGSKERQIKLQGQRVNVANIEEMLRLAVPDVQDFALEFVTTKTKARRRGLQLVGFIILDPELRDYSKQVHTATQSANAKIEEILPDHTENPIFVALPELPLAGGTVDRRRLHQIASSLAAKALDEMRLVERSTFQSTNSDAVAHTQGSDSAEQSFAQSSCWVSDQLHRLSTRHIIHHAIRVHGVVQEDALKTALTALQSRHAILRTTFSSQNGLNVQRMHQRMLPRLRLTDLDIDGSDESRLALALDQAETTSFDLNNEPGLAVSLYRLPNADHVLALAAHQMIADRWSINVLLEELSSIYTDCLQAKDPLSRFEPPHFQYGDYASWQKQPTQLAKHEKQLEYWAEKLHESQPAEFLTDKPRSGVLSGKAGRIQLNITDGEHDKLKAYCKHHNVTPLVIIFSVLRATHFRHTNARDATFGIVDTNRDGSDLGGMIGPVANLQCIRLNGEDETFDSLVQQVASTVQEASDNKDVPFERIASRLNKGRDMSRHPLVQVVLSLDSSLGSSPHVFGGSPATQLDLKELTSIFDLEFNFATDKDKLQGSVTYSKDLYDAASVEQMAHVFNTMLGEALDSPKTPIASLPLLTENAHSVLDKMGLIQIEQPAYPHESSLTDIFRQQVTKHASSIAVKDSLISLTYAELDHQSDMVAQSLASRKLPTESLIGVYANRSCETIVVFLGILKANLAYLPFDIKTPMGRMRSILSSVQGHKVVLTGSDTQHPQIELEDVEFLSIVECLREGSKIGSLQPILEPPTATSLAYVIFTSGSTGKPKGVMVNHRAVVRLVVNGNLVRELSGAKTLAHMTNIAFDVSSWEIYAALLNGGTLVCIDAMTVLNYTALTDVFVREGVQVANMTPALYKQYLSECPDTLALLDVVIVGGDRIDTHDVLEARKIMPGKIVNGYGPTENTGFSTFYSLKDDQCANGMPIGRAVSNSGAYVMDPELRIVPLGILGELVVTGDGLARGYTDAQLDIDRFVQVFIDGKSTRAYRTGDYVRYRPSDGELEFFGRIDGQVKIRGHRIEIDEIEYTIRGHKSVTDAAVVLQKQENRSPQLVGFLTVSADAEYNETSADSNEADVMNTWEEVFDSDTYVSVDNVHGEALGRDFIGWMSTYDGSEIDKVEMNEWLDDTVQTILNGDELVGNILEIGTGTGMVLFNLPPKGLKSYMGLEPSAKAVHFVARRAQSLPGLADKVSVHKGTAADLGKVSPPTPPDLVVVNSVAQYFPSHQYLFRAIKDILDLGNVKTIFFGDIRSQALCREFEISKVLHADGKAASKSEMKRRIADLSRTERELLVDPGYFTSLVDRLPEFIQHVEILPKRMTATNELSCYRYAAVLHVKRDSHQLPKVYAVDEKEWVDFDEDGLDKEHLLELVQQRLSVAPSLAIANIPYKKTVAERQVLESIFNDTNESVALLLSKARKRPSLSAVDLQELAERAGCQVAISWARQHSQHGGLDAIFHNYMSESGGRVLFNFPTDHTGRHLHTLASKPMRQLIERQLQHELHERLQALLPPYMVPSSIKALESLPVNENGKIDRKTLALTIQAQSTADGQKRAPETEAERRLQQIWAQVLHIDAEDIGLDDSFFRLGGDSIAAMKMVGVARKAGVALEVTDIFRHRTLVQQAQITTRAVNGVMEATSAFSLLPTKKAARDVCSDLAALCGIDAAHIQDAYPCTPLQEGLLSLTAKREGSYIRQTVLELSSTIDINTLKAAWDHALSSTAILRTRIVQHPQMGLVQVVCRGEIEWSVTPILEEYLKKDRSQPMGLGDSLMRLTLVGETGDKRQSLVWTVHHALYDGWSHNLVMDLVSRAYRGHKLAARAEFNSFVKHVGSINDARSETFWRSYLADGEFAPFPPLPATIQEPSANESFELVLPPIAPTEVTMSTLIRAALAVVISQYTGSADIVFGAVVSGRNAPVKGIDEIVGPTIATVPVRVKVDKDGTVAEYLQQVQQQATDMIAYEQTGLQRIAKVSDGGRDASAFQTLLVVQPQEYDLRADDMFGTWSMSSSQEAFTTYAITLQCLLGSQGATISANYDSRVVDKWLMEKMMHQLGVVMNRLANPRPDWLLRDVDSLTSDEAKKLWEWNEAIPETVENCVHNLIVAHAEERPEAPAICAWDGEMTYSELNLASAKLAHYLIEYGGVGPEVVVPLCFEKSMWTVVAILGVLKAGGAFVLLDHALPEARLHKICGQVKATTAVTSTSCQKRLASLTSRTVVLNQQLLDTLPFPTTLVPKGTGVGPSNAAYMIFTSGSTGEPKGCVIEHGSYCTSAMAHGSVKNMDSNTRALQFGSYNFAGSIIEILMTMIYGGCVCVLSEEERGSELAPSIRRLNANWAFMTSTVLANLTPDEVPCLKTICVGGEPIRSSQIREWAPRVHLRQTYGSAETSGVVSSARLYSETSAISDVGKATTGRFWLVDPTDLNRLAPIGTPGEILVEGAVVGREYKGEPEKTAAAFIATPIWRIAFGPAGTELRFYRTGDLAKYRSDGSIELLGRKDTQIKLRGQRIEVGEIEYQARLAAPGVKDVAVELTMLNNGDSKHPQLIGFIVLSGEGKATDDYKERTRTAVHDILARLESVLPHYMVPSIFVPVQELPLTASGKTNRRVLRDMGSALSANELEELRKSGRGPTRKPTTAVERQMQKVWARVLNIEADTIGLDDRFFRLGGDSIAAMKVVGEARKVGIKLAVADIFRHNTLARLTEHHSLASESFDQSYEEALLIDPKTKQALLDELDTLAVGFTSETVADILPLTSFQETVVVDGVEGLGELCSYFWLDIGNDVDIQRLEQSCASALQRHPILRACFLLLQGRFWQVVLEHMDQPLRILDVVGDMDIACQDFCAEDTKAFAPTEPPVAFILLRHPEQGMRLVFRASHAQYDGVSMPVIFQGLIAGYHGIDLPPSPPFSRFLQYAAHQQDNSAAYWRKVLDGSSATSMRSHLRPLGVAEGAASTRITAHATTRLPPHSDNATSASIVSAAWAMLLSLITGETDVVYGYLVAGRNSALPSIEDVVGPCVNIIPVRANTFQHKTPAELLLSIQKQFIELGEADSLGYDAIINRCTDWPSGSTLDSIIQFQNIDEHPTLRFADTESPVQYYENPRLIPPEHPSMHVVFYPEGEALKVKLTANSRVLGEETADALLAGLCKIVEQFSGGVDVSLQSFMDGIRVDFQG